MTLNFQLDRLEGVDETIQALYVKKGGNFVLCIEGLPQPGDVSGLKAKVDELLGEKKTAQKKGREAEEAARLEREELARKSGNVEELQRPGPRSTPAAKQTGQLESANSTLRGQIRDLTVGRTATEIAATLAIPGGAKALLPHIERRLSVEQRDGELTVVVLDAVGNLPAATLDELKAEFTNDPSFGPLIAGSKASGGASGAGKGGGAVKGNICGTKEERTAALASWFPDLPLKYEKAPMSLSQMQVFNEYTMQAMLETLDLMLVTFNTASRGAIILNPERVSHQSKRQRGRPKQSLKWFKMP